MMILVVREFVYSQTAPSDGVSFQAITFADANTVVAVGDSGTIARSTDMGSTWSMWRNVNHVTTPLLGVAFVNAAHGFAVGANGGLLMTTNGGTSWTNQLINSPTAFSTALSLWTAKQELLSAITEQFFVQQMMEIHG